MPIWIALAGNCLVGALTFATYGWNAASAHAATRNTARFSLLWFIVGFGASGLARWMPALPAQASLIRAFVAAHMVHFTVVSILVATFEPAQLSQHPGRTAAIVLIGFLMVLGAGLTATQRTSRLYTAVQKVTQYSIFLILFLAFLSNAVKPLRLLTIPLGLALILRLTSGMSFSRLRHAHALPRYPDPPR